MAKLRPSLLSALCFALCFCSILVAVAHGQTASPIGGEVLSEDGQPIADVSVYSNWKQCCPYQQDSTKTNDLGLFHLDHSGTVLHFWKKGFQPKALVISASDSMLRIAMDSSRSERTVPACGPEQNGQKRVGWGKYGLQFTVPEKGANIKSGKPDVDYVRYVLILPKSKSYLEFWFGVYAMSAEPNDELLVKSLDFTQLSLGGEGIGEDSRGHLKRGRNWRQTAIIGQGGAIYRDVPLEEARVFDQIIESMCIIPYPEP
jgi:hypothetical protein